MIFLKQVVDGVLAEQNRSLSWLASEMGKTFDGLRLSLIKGSIKYIDIQKMAKVLNIPVVRLFTEPAEFGATATNMILNEPAEAYRINNKLALQNCQEMVDALKSQLKDKDKIITLLSK